MRRTSIRNGDYQKAVDEYRRAIELIPDDIAAHCGLGNALHKLGRDSEAIVAYSESVRTGQHWAGARACRFWLAYLQFQAGKLAEARDQFQILLSENASDCSARVYVALIDRAEGKPGDLERLKRESAPCLGDIPEVQ